MRIGLCTTDFHYAQPAAELFAKVRKMGYNSVQLAFAAVEECHFKSGPEFEFPDGISEEATAAILAAAAKNNIHITAVNGTWNMTHPDAAVRAEGLIRFDHFLKSLKAFGNPIVSLCSGSRSRQHMWRYDAASHTPEAWTDLLASMKGVCALAEKYGVILALETEASNVIDTPEKAERLLREVSSPNLKMILDGANLFHAGEATVENMRPAIDRAMRCFGRDVVLAHGKDIGPSDGISFCSTGHGIVDFPYMLKKLQEFGFDGDMILHGIYDEEDMAPCCHFMQDIINSL